MAETVVRMAAILVFWLAIGEGLFSTLERTREEPISAIIFLLLIVGWVYMVAIMGRMFYKASYFLEVVWPKEAIFKKVQQGGKSL